MTPRLDPDFDGGVHRERHNMSRPVGMRFALGDQSRYLRRARKAGYQD